MAHRVLKTRHCPGSRSRDEKKIMKKLAVLMLGCSLAFNFAAFAETKESDQKWLQAVQEMVAKGESKVKVSTANGARVTLLKEWGTKKGYSVDVTKTETGYSIHIARQLASK